MPIPPESFHDIMVDSLSSTRMFETSLLAAKFFLFTASTMKTESGCGFKCSLTQSFLPSSAGIPLPRIGADKILTGKPRLFKNSQSSVVPSFSGGSILKKSPGLAEIADIMTCLTGFSSRSSRLLGRQSSPKASRNFLIFDSIDFELSVHIGSATPARISEIKLTAPSSKSTRTPSMSQ